MIAPEQLAELSPAAALEATQSTTEGLSGSEARSRLERLGPNELGRGSRTAPGLLLAQLRSPLLGLLVAAAGVSIVVGERVDGGIILGIMALSVGLGFYNEFRSEQTLAALRGRTGRRATVMRDGEHAEIAAAELVVGDVCLLQTGDVVPADLRLLEASELVVEEAALTGEPYPVEKAVAPRADEHGVTRVSSCYSGTVVRGGRGLGVVVATGSRTRLGAVAGGLGERQPPTVFQRGLTSFAVLLARVTAILTAVIFVANFALGRPFLDSLLFSLAIAVGLTPQLLPAIVTVSLSTGARRMAKRSVLVKRLVSIEDLGDVDILFTDKTGTLTEGEIRLREALSSSGEPAPELVRLGLLAGDLSFAHGKTPLGNTLDLAVWAALDPAVARAELEAAQAVAVLPFTFERRRSSVVLDGPHGRRLLCKGAAEEVLARCANRPSGVDALLDRLADSGLRVLAIAERPIDVRPSYSESDEVELELDGFLVFEDPPKADARESIDRLQRLGIELKVLTGDNERTAAHVCEGVGLPVKGVVSGADLDGLDEAGLARLVATSTIFARVSPEQKALLVGAAQTGGAAVAFLGDGINDAVALHQALHLLVPRDEPRRAVGQRLVGAELDHRPAHMLVGVHDVHIACARTVRGAGQGSCQRRVLHPCGDVDVLPGLDVRTDFDRHRRVPLEPLV